MPSFLGRSRELALLTTTHASDQSALIPIYGRRRVGKSELILRLIASTGGLYVHGKQAAPEVQIRELLELAAEALGDPLLARVHTESWREALSLVVERWARPGKLVLALDEFQWMVEASPELPSVIQELWDRYWRDSGKVMLILCGSYIGFMEREILGKKSPLFGRRTAQIHLKPFGFREARAFHPNYSLIDAARTYAICGGIPLYLKAFQPDRSFEQNIKRCLLSEFAPLYREPDFLLREELREVKNYYSVLMAMAQGATNHRAISKNTGLEARNLPYYLSQLIELGYIDKRHPLIAGKTPRNVRYRLSDPLLSFWFRFIFPSQSFLLRGGPDRAWSALIAPHIEAYLGLRFEALCKEALAELYLEEGVSASFQIGEYWDRDVQIDIVGLRDDGWIDLCECRWGSTVSAKEGAKQLRERRLKYPNPRGATIALHIFSKARPKGWKDTDGVRWHGLSEIYGV